MLGVKPTNLDAFDASVQRWLSAVEEAAASAAVGLAQKVLDKVLIESPQYSADFVANWKVSINQPDRSFTIGVIRPKVADHPDKDGIHQFKPFKRGDAEGIAYAKAHAHWGKIKLGDKIYISNSAAHDEPYAMKIEQGAIHFRQVNQGAEAVGRRSVQFVANRYPTIGASQLAALRRHGV